MNDSGRGEAPRYHATDWIAATDAALPRSAKASAALLVRLFLCAIITGLGCATLAGASETATHWLSDMRSGRCKDFPFATEELCCHMASDRDASAEALADRIAEAAVGLESCPHWVTSAGGESVLQLGVFVVLSTLLAVVAALLARSVPGCSGSGIVELKAFLAGVEVPHLFRPELLLRKAVGLCASVGSGLAVGKEGPFVHLGACVAAMATRAMPSVERSTVLRREVISAGAAAGVAVAFGAPIGGVVFVLEETGFVLRRRCVLVCLVASAVATLALKSIDPSGTGRVVQFAVSHRLPWHWFELPLFALLGAAGGVFGVLVVKLNEKLYHGGPSAASSLDQQRRGGGGLAERWRELTKSWPITHIVSLTVITCAVSYGSPLLRRGMLEVLHDLFMECGDHAPVDSTTSDVRTTMLLFSGATGSEALCHGASATLVIHLLTAAAIKSFLMVLTIGAQLPQGCFVPSLFVGAAIGRAAGAWLQAVYRASPDASLFAACGSDLNGSAGDMHGEGSMTVNFDCIAPSIYAMVGAAAALTGLTRMILSIAVIMFELTGGIDYIAPCLLASLISKYVASALLQGASIYEAQLERSVLPYLEIDPADGDYHPDLEQNIAELLPSMPKNIAVLWDGMTLAQAKAVVGDGPPSVAVSRAPPSPAAASGATARATRSGRSTPTPDTALDTTDPREPDAHQAGARQRERGADHHLVSAVHRCYPVMSSRDGSGFVGCVSREDLLLRASEAAALGWSEQTLVTFGTGAIGVGSPAAGTAGGGNAGGGSGPGTKAGGRRGSRRTLQWSSVLEPLTVRLSTSATVRHALLAFETLGVHHVVVCRLDNFAAMLTRNDVIGFLRRRQHSRDDPLANRVELGDDGDEQEMVEADG